MPNPFDEDNVATSPERLDRMQSQWWSMLRPTGVSAEAGYAAFDDLAARYEEQHRHYHTLEHIAEMLRIVPRLTPTGIEMFPIQLAVWFHDAVYDTHSSTNEFDSSQYALGVMRGLGLVEATTTEVARLILSTDHRFHNFDDAPESYRILHDADLAILGAAPERYDRYAADVRKEYAWVPEKQFRTGRARILQTFLERPRIYLTEVMKVEGEAAARQNLEREWKRLGEGDAPSC